MFRASPWISYDPSPQHSKLNRVDGTEVEFDSNSLLTPSSPQQELLAPQRDADMDAPEISTLREEEEETPPPEVGRRSFSKFRVNMRLSSWVQGTGASGSAIGPPVGPPPASRRAPSIPDSDEEDEEDQLIDDDELAIVTETGRGPNTSSPGSLVATGSPASTSSPRKRGGSTRGRQRRGGATGRRGRPGREPPDAAAMMSTFEITKTEQAASSPVQIIPPTPVLVPTPPQVAGPSTGDWPASPPKPPRKKPGPKKGSTLGPRGPRKPKTSALNTPGSSTPLLDDSLVADPSAFLIPAPPSIPPTPGPDQLPLPTSHLPPILPPDFNLDPTIPVPTYPLPTRSFPVQMPPKILSGYALSHPVDPKRAPVRKWTIMKREIKGIGGGHWFARTWVAPQSVLQPPTRPSSPPIDLDMMRARPGLEADAEPEPEAGPSAASSVKAEIPPAPAFSDADHVDHGPWSVAVKDIDGGLSSRDPASPRTSVSPSPPPDASEQMQVDQASLI